MGHHKIIIVNNFIKWTVCSVSAVTISQKYAAGMTNSVDFDQIAIWGAVWSQSALSAKTFRIRTAS